MAQSVVLRHHPYHIILKPSRVGCKSSRIKTKLHNTQYNGHYGAMNASSSIGNICSYLHVNMECEAVAYLRLCMNSHVEQTKIPVRLEMVGSLGVAQRRDEKYAVRENTQCSRAATSQFCIIKTMR